MTVPKDLKEAPLARIGLVLEELDPKEYHRVCKLPLAQRRAAALRRLNWAPDSTWDNWKPAINCKNKGATPLQR